MQNYGLPGKVRHQGQDKVDWILRFAATAATVFGRHRSIFYAASQFALKPDLEPTRLVLRDETGVTTKMARLRRRAIPTTSVTG